MSDSGIAYFGDFLDGTDIQEAATTTLQKYMNTYLAGWERHRGQEVGSMARPPFGGYTTSVDEDFDKRQDGDLPAVLVICPGLAEPPVTRGSKILMRWLLGIAVIAKGADGADAERAAKGYGACVRSIFLKQSRSLGGVISGLSYIDERYDEYEVPDPASRSLATARLTFYVDTELDGVRFNPLPPGDITPPDEQPPEEDPTVQRFDSVHTIVKKPGSSESATTATSVEVE